MQYTVKSGDSLSKIALKFGQPASAWQMLFEQNKAQIKNPDLIYPGQILNIPISWDASKAQTPPILAPGSVSPTQTPQIPPVAPTSGNKQTLFIVGGALLALFLANRKKTKRRKR
jgi:LysM repeat protein